MDYLEKLLDAEVEAFAAEEMFLRHFAIHLKGRDKIDMEPMYAAHRQCCREYYELYGTIKGPLTPWTLGRRAIEYGTEKED